MSALFPSTNWNTLTPADLARSPTTLLHKSSKSVERGIFDGKCGQVLTSGEYFVYTPNADSLPLPSTPHTACRLQLRRDYRFGQEDPVLWPQPYCAPYAYFAAIPSRPADSTHPLAIWWWTPQQRDMTLSSTGLGSLRYSCVAPFERPTAFLRSRVDDYVKKCHSLCQESNKAVTVYTLAAEHALKQLLSLEMTFHQACLCLIEMQKSYLFAIAALDWIEVYSPRYEGLTPPAPTVAETIGTIVYDPKISTRLARAGIPVWVVLPYTQLKATRIDSLASMLDPSSVLDLIPARGASAIYRGDPGQVAYDKMSTFYAQSLIAPPSSTLSRAPTSRSSSSRLSQSLHNRTRPYPTSKPPKSKGSSGRDPFSEPSSQFWPPTPDVWIQALTTVDRLSSSPNHINDHRRWYSFPDPALFHGVQTPEKMYAYLRKWMEYRQAMIYRFLHPGNTQSLSTDHWRCFLSDDLSNIQQNDRRKAKKEEMRDIVNTCRQQLDTAGDYYHERLRWQGEKLSMTEVISPTAVKQILSELSELNFCRELMVLDDYLAPSHSAVRRRDLVMDCFADRDSLYTVSLDAIGKGLAANDLRQRAPFFFKLSNLMKDWPNNERMGPTLRKGLEKCSDSDLSSFESRVANFYTQSFYNYFVRAPTLPRRYQ